MNNLDLDLSILKVLISNKKQALDFVNDCDTKLFGAAYWNFANLLVGYIKTYKDIPTLRVIEDRLSKGKNEKIIENVKVIWKQLEDTSYDDKEYKYDLEKLKNRYSELEISNVADDLVKMREGPVDVKRATAKLQTALQNIKSVTQVKAYERRTLKDDVPLFREEYNAKLKNPEFDAGIKTNYSVLDFATDGLRPGELILIGGESGAGKSMLLMNAALQIWLQNNTIDMDDNFSVGQSVLYFSLEMPFKPCRNRVLSRLSSCQSKLVRAAKLPPEEAIKLKKVLKFIEKYPYEFEIIDIPRGATMESLEVIFEESKARFDPKIVVIDYLGLMEYEGGKDMDDWLKLGKIAEKMHEFARVNKCVVLSAVQLNRVKPSKDAEERVGLHRIGRSGLIMQNANIAVQIESRMNEKQHPDMVYHLIKNRDGELCKGKLIKNLACGTLIDEKSDNMDDMFTMVDIDDISEKIDMLDL